MARILIAFVAAILSFCVATALFFFSYEWYEKRLVDAVWWAGFSSILVGFICLMLWAFRDKVFRFFNLSTKTGLQHLIDPVTDIVEHGLGGRVIEAASETKVLLHRLLSRYTAIKTMNWIIGTTFGFLAIFATMAATAVLVKQNRLIESQNKYFQEQNSKIQKQLDEQAVERKRADRNRLIDILYQENGVEKGAVEAILGFVSKENKRKIPKANLRLRQEAALEFIKLEYEASKKPFFLDLSNALLNDIVFEDYIFQKAGLGDALAGATFMGAHLENAKFFGSHLENTVFINTYLNDAYFGSAHLEGAYFEGADLAGAYFGGTFLKGAHFSNAKVDSPNWIENLRKLDPPVSGFDFSFWSVVRMVDESGDFHFVLRAPEDSDENRINHIELKK